MKKALSILVMGIVSILILSTASSDNVPLAAEFSAGRFSESIPSEVIWSENFDGNISEWDIYGINSTEPLPDELCIGNFSLDGGIMRATGKEWNIASRNSSIAYGTWSFDVDIQDPDDEWHFVVAFIQYHFSQRDLDEGRLSPGYALGFYIPDAGKQEIRLIRGSHDLSPKGLYLDYYYNDDITGWKHFIITREPSGQFFVYMNDTLILEGKNTDYTTCERFSFSTRANPAIDNIIVNDTIEYDKAPPVWDNPITNQHIVEGESFRYDINASDYSGIDTWRIDDTENFTIDQSGVITDNTILAQGEYGIGVWVNDTKGNTRYESFTLSVLANTVTSSTGSNGFPLSIELVLAAAGGVIVVLLVVVLWRRQK